ncbi:MAG: hypothetical protein U0790_00090 [Isosphaeraceae bacterium]
MSDVFDEKSAAVIDAMRTLPIKLACDLAGVGRSTVYEWLERGEKGEEPYAAFKALAAQARAEFVRDRLNEIQSAGRDSKHSGWKATAWYLERVWPEFFRPSRTVEHTGPGGGPMPIRVDMLTDEQLRQLDTLLGQLVDRGPGSNPPEGPRRALPPPPG